MSLQLDALKPDTCVKFDTPRKPGQVFKQFLRARLQHTFIQNKLLYFLETLPRFQVTKNERLIVTHFFGVSIHYIDGSTDERR